MRLIFTAGTVFFLLFSLACSDSGSTSPVTGDGDSEFADGDIGEDEDTAWDAEVADEVDKLSEEETDPDPDTVEETEHPEDVDEMETADESEEEPAAVTPPYFSGFSAAGGTVTNNEYRLYFRLAPAAVTVKAANGQYRLNATVTPDSK